MLHRFFDLVRRRYYRECCVICGMYIWFPTFSDAFTIYSLDGLTKVGMLHNDDLCIPSLVESVLAQWERE